MLTNDLISKWNKSKSSTNQLEHKNRQTREEERKTKKYVFVKHTM